MITDLQIKRIHSAQHFSEIYLQDGGKINWHRYGTKLRHCHPMYNVVDTGTAAPYCVNANH